MKLPHIRNNTFVVTLVYLISLQFSPSVVDICDKVQLLLQVQWLWYQNSKCLLWRHSLSPATGETNRLEGSPENKEHDEKEEQK